MQNLSMTLRKQIFPIGLILILALARLIPHPPNFTPIIAVAIMSGYFFKNVNLSKNYVGSQRFSDEEISEKFGSVKEIIGKQGTILFEDTSGFHKGKPVETGHRVILQLEYCCSRFDGKDGSPRTTQIINNVQKFSPKFKEFIHIYPRIFGSCMDQ